MKIAVIGCGSSGLATAAFLRTDDHDVQLFEQFSAPKPLGAGLLLQPTGLACLAQLGLDQQAIALGAPVHSLLGKTVNDQLVLNLQYQHLGERLFGLGIHRASLFSLLYEHVQSLAIEITTDCEIVDTQGENCQRIIIDKQGQHYGPYDLVIDASGMHSPLRDGYGNCKYNRLYSYAAIWGVCDDPDQQFGGHCLQQRYDSAKVMMGVLPIGKLSQHACPQVAFFWSMPVNSYLQWRQQGITAWRQQVIDYWPAVAGLVQQFKQVDDLTYAQYRDVVMCQWHTENLLWIGDAAHCTSPQLGQGANLGLIDALTISKCLRETNSVERALLAYTQQRKKHIKFYQTASRWLTPFFQSDSRLAAWLRDVSFARIAKVPYINSQLLSLLAGIKAGLFECLDSSDWRN